MSKDKDNTTNNEKLSKPMLELNRFFQVTTVDKTQSKNIPLSLSNQNIVKSEEINLISSESPNDEMATKRYEEYCKLYFSNIILINQLKVLLNEKNSLIQKLRNLDVKIKRI